MIGALIVATAAFLPLLPQFNNADAAGPYDGEWTGIATSTGERCKPAAVKLTLKARLCWAKQGLSAIHPTSTELFAKTARLGRR